MTIAPHLSRHLLGCACLWLAACSRPATGEPAKIDLIAKAASDSAASALTPAATVALDSANRLFRAKRYEAALAQYRLAAQASPGHATPFFGIYMVARARHDTRLADSAMARIRASTH